MKEMGRNSNVILKNKVMETNYGLIDLTENELKENNGGLSFSPIWLLDPRDPFAFFRGLREAWKSSTQF